MKRLLLLVSIIAHSALFGYSYDELLIKAQTTLFPKIMLLDRKLDNKLVDGKILYLIAYEESDDISAAGVRDLLVSTYSGMIEGHPVEFRTIPYDCIDDDTQATAIYALRSREHQIGKVAAIARAKGIITFAYEIAYLRQGLLFSLMVEKSTVLYLSRKNIQKYDVDFVDVLYQIVRFIDE